MVLIKRERKGSKINYDYWNEVQKVHQSQKNIKVKEKKISEQIEKLLEE